MPCPPRLLLAGFVLSACAGHATRSTPVEAPSAMSDPPYESPARSGQALALLKAAVAEYKNGNLDAANWNAAGAIELLAPSRVRADAPVAEYCVPDPCPQAPRFAPTPRARKSAGAKASNAAGVVATLRPAFTTCYSAGLARDSRLMAYVDIEMSVRSDGAVSTVAARRIGYLDDTTTGCVLHVALGARFPPPSDGSAVIRLPIWLVPSP